MPVPQKKPITSKSSVSMPESSSPVLPEQEEFRQHLRCLAVSAVQVLIEHVMRVIVGICRRAIVLDFGHVLAEGEPEVVLRDERVVKAYLGERYAKRLRGERGQDSAS